MKNKYDIKYVVFRHDRIGMQLYAIINAIYYCKKHNLEYVHIQLDDSYIEYTKLFKLGEGYETMSIETFKQEHQYIKSEIKNLGWLFSLVKKKNIEEKRIKECNINYKSSAFLIYQSELINKYKKSELYKEMFTDNNINICIHYRRGDVININSAEYKNINVMFKKRNNLRYTPDNFINDIIDKLNIYMSDLPLNIHIHSDSVVDLDNLITSKHNFKIYSHFDDSPIEALNCMIQADILFRYGISAFSGVAAFYNTNIVISNIQEKYERLYNFSNTYMFKKCDDLLKFIAKKFKNV